MSKILDKINKLILHAKSAELVGHQAEAAAFRKTIRRLSRKHGVKMADVRAYVEKHSPIETEIVQAPPCDLEYWQVVFFSVATTFKGCRGLVLDNGGLSVVGRRQQRCEAVSLYRKFVISCEKLTQEFLDSQKTERQFVATGSYGGTSYSISTTTASIYFVPILPVSEERRRNSFAIGLAEAIAQEAMTRMRQRQKSEAKPKTPKPAAQATMEMALAIIEKPLVDPLAEIDEYIAERIRVASQVTPQQGHVEPPQPEPIDVDGESFQSGKMAAKEIEW